MPNVFLKKSTIGTSAVSAIYRGLWASLWQRGERRPSLPGRNESYPICDIFQVNIHGLFGFSVEIHSHLGSNNSEMPLAASLDGTLCAGGAAGHVEGGKRVGRGGRQRGSGRLNMIIQKIRGWEKDANGKSGAVGANWAYKLYAQ